MSKRTRVVGTHSFTLWILIVIVVLLLAGVAVGGLVVLPQIQRGQTQQARLDEAEQHYQAGVAFQNVGDWAAVEGEYKQVISIDANYKDVQARLAEVKAKLAENQATATAVAIAQAEQAQAEAQATATTQAQATAEAQANAQATATAQAEATATAKALDATATAETLEAQYQRGLGYINLEKWVEAKAELEQVFAADPNYKEVQAKLTEVEAKLKELNIPTATSTPTLTGTPLPDVTPTSTPVESSPTPQSVEAQIIVIDDKTHHLGDNKTNWDVPNPEGTSYTNRFWLDTIEPGVVLLRLDTFHIDSANPIWVNNQLVGVVPGSRDLSMDSDRWNLQVEVFVPGSILKVGENSVQIESYKEDDFMFRKLQAVTGATISPDPSHQTQLIVDDATHHIGDQKMNGWAVPAPEGTFYTKYFSLDSDPQSDAILQLASFEANYANVVWANGCYIGVLPGLGTKDWTPEVSMRIPMSCLSTGPNVIRIDSLKNDKGNHDDFMVKDIKILVTLK